MRSIGGKFPVPFISINAYQFTKADVYDWIKKEIERVENIGYKCRIYYIQGSVGFSIVVARTTHKGEMFINGDSGNHSIPLPANEHFRRFLLLKKKPMTLDELKEFHKSKITVSKKRKRKWER